MKDNLPPYYVNLFWFHIMHAPEDNVKITFGEGQGEPDSAVARVAVVMSRANAIAMLTSLANGLNISDPTARAERGSNVEPFRPAGIEPKK